jgi:hypothetical protein
MQVILGDLNTQANSLARLSPHYCTDHMRWASFGWFEAEVWAAHVLGWPDHKGPDRPRHTTNNKRGDHDPWLVRLVAAVAALITKPNQVKAVLHFMMSLEVLPQHAQEHAVPFSYSCKVAAVVGWQGCCKVIGCISRLAVCPCKV